MSELNHKNILDQYSGGAKSGLPSGVIAPATSSRIDVNMDSDRSQGH